MYHSFSAAIIHSIMVSYYIRYALPLKVVNLSLKILMHSTMHINPIKDSKLILYTQEDDAKNKCKVIKTQHENEE